MFKPSPQLCGRLRFTTKEVGRGFYRGNRTGSMGSHTGFGGYVVDWRKTPVYNCPEIQGFNLTPFVTLEMEPLDRSQDMPDGTIYTPPKVDALEFLKEWKRLNPEEFERILDHQEQHLQNTAASESKALDSTDDASLGAEAAQTTDDVHVAPETPEIKKS